MSIELIGGTGKTVTPPDDGVFYRAMAWGKDAILSGCALSIVSTSKIKITAGHLLVCGRICKVAEESLTVSLASSGTQTKYLWVELAPQGTPVVKFNSGSSYAAGDNINADESGTYKALLCVYTATTSAVSTVSARMTTPANFELVGKMLESNAQSIPNNAFTILTYNSATHSDMRWIVGVKNQGILIPAGYSGITVNAYVILDDTTASGVRKLAIIHMRGETETLVATTASIGNGELPELSCGGSIDVQEGDIVFAKVYQNSGGARDVVAGYGKMLSYRLT